MNRALTSHVYYLKLKFQNYEEKNYFSTFNSQFYSSIYILEVIVNISLDNKKELYYVYL